MALEQAAKEIIGSTTDSSAQIEVAARSLGSAGNSARTAFHTAEGAFDRTSSAVGKRSPLHREALGTLRAVAAAAKSLRDLADSLEQHPEALIRGKK